MKIYAFTFYKNKNSTKVPDSIGDLIEVRLKEGCSLLAPRFRITSGNWPETANYIRASIGGKVRYYFVDDVVPETNNDRYIVCIYDYPASNRASILNASEFVVRTSDKTKVNALITDNQVMAQNLMVSSTAATESDIFSLAGCYVVGVLFKGISHPITQRGQVSYIAFTKAQLSSFIDQVLEIGPSVFSAMAPIQYIVSCVYIPVSIGTLSSTTDNVKFGGYTLNNFGYSYVELDSTNGLIEKSIGSITLPQHPQKASIGDYLNYAPYSRYTLFAGPFGDFDLPDEIVGGTTITLSMILDVTDGTAKLDVYHGGSVVKLRGRVGVDTVMSQISSNPLGVASSIINGVSAGASVVLGNPAGVIGMMGSGISAIQNLIPTVQTRGFNGSMAELKESKISVVAHFLKVATDGDPIAFIGRPCYKTLTLSTLAAGSYVMCSDVKIEIPGYSTEQDEVKRLLETGIFLE